MSKKDRETGFYLRKVGRKVPHVPKEARKLAAMLKEADGEERQAVSSQPIGKRGPWLMS